MAEEEEYLRIPGHISVKKAAELLNISYKRTYDYVHSGRIPSRKVGGKRMIPENALKDFQKNPPGRARKEGAEWHLYSSRIKVFDTQISVQLRAGQQERFVQRVQQLYRKKLHTFKGTMIRVIWQNDEHPDRVTLLLVWKDNEMPGEETRRRELEAFQRDFADVLDWDTAQIKHGNVLLST